MSSLLLLLAASEIYARWTAELRGTNVAALPAAALGFDLRAFKGPVVVGSHFFGTESFHWEAAAADGSLNRLSLLMSDERFCWTTVRTGEIKNHGCVVAGASVQ